MKIVVLDGFTENPGDLSWDAIKSFGELIVYDRTHASQVRERVGEADIIVTNKTAITRDVIENAPNLKLITVLATGYDAIDIKAAKCHEIIVSNVPSYGSDAVGQFAIALLLEIASRVGHHDQAVKNGRWSANPDWTFWDFPLMELANKTIGIIGFGRIGQTTGRIAKAMNMHVLAFDKYENDSGKEIATYSNLDTLLQNSDVIVLHCNLTTETKEIINKATISKMKNSVIIINNARGALINEHDLAEALNQGRVFAAALDVVSSEPIAKDNPLLSAKNCIITPHISWAPIECRQRIMDITQGNIQAFLNKSPSNIVNM